MQSGQGCVECTRKERKDLLKKQKQSKKAKPPQEFKKRKTKIP